MAFGIDGDTLNPWKPGNDSLWRLIASLFQIVQFLQKFLYTFVQIGSLNSFTR